MTLHIHLLHHPENDGLTILKKQLHPNIRITSGDPAENAAYHILVAGVPRREHLVASPDLHTLVIPWAGLPGATRSLLAEFPHLSVHNLHHNAQPVAELVLALLLAAARAVVPMDQALRVGDWRPRYDRPGPSLLLGGKTALILGYGAIGQRVARLCQAFDMRVLATRRALTAPQQDGSVTVHPDTALPSLLPQAHALLICLPLTPTTDGLLGAQELSLLPTPAILVNIGRAAIVDEAALFAALQSRQLHAAGLDVWYNYPPDETARTHTMPANFPFHELDNVVLSPHRGGAADGSVALRMHYLAQLLNRAAMGGQLPNQVDLEAGY